MLHRLLHDDEADVKAAAIEALGQLGSQASVVLIGAALGDRAFLVRRSAGIALDTLGAPGHLVLRRHLRDPDRYARDMARQMLDAAAARRGLDLVPPIGTIEIPVVEPVAAKPQLVNTTQDGSSGASVLIAPRVADVSDDQAVLAAMWDLMAPEIGAAEPPPTGIGEGDPA